MSDDQELIDRATSLIDLLRSKGLKLATAESCTGGLIAGAVTEVAGSSDVFDRGFVTYSNEAKTEMLGVPAALIATHGAVSPQVAREMADIVERGYVIVGSPKDVTEQLEHVAKTLNVGHLMLLLQFGNMSKELTKANTKLFAEKVMPKLKPLFAEWEDKWWPKPMARAERAALPAFSPGARAAE